MKNIKTIIIAIFATLLVSTTAVAEVAIIVGSGSGASALDAKTAKKLFLGKVKSIPGMSAVTLVGQVDDSPTKAKFTKAIAKKGLDKYKAYWSKMIFSGKAVPPKELANDAEVKAYVAKNADAVGYINANAVDDSVKVLLRAP
jgi:hypothetical protein